MRTCLGFAALVALAFASIVEPAFGDGTLKPRIVTPVHEGVSAVFVESVQIGSDVYLYYIDADGEAQRIGYQTSVSEPVRFETSPTDPVDALKKNWKLVACAKRGGGVPVCTEPVAIRPRPTKLMNQPAYAGGSVLYQGAACAGTLDNGLLPGSQVILRDRSDPSDPDPYEYAAEVQPGRQITLMLENQFWPRSQHNLRIVGQLGGKDITPELWLPQPVTYGQSAGCEREVDPPSFAGLPEACRRNVSLDSLVPGGQFGVSIEGGAVIFGPQHCATSTTLNLRLGAWLKAHSTLLTQQQIKGASLASCSTTRQFVGPLNLPDIDVLPIAPDQSELAIRKLVESAVIEIKVTSGTGQPQTYVNIPVQGTKLNPFPISLAEPFRPGDKVHIKEMLGPAAECQLTKETEVPVAPRADGLDKLEIFTPVYACTSEIAVRNHKQGATITVTGTGNILTTAGESDLLIGRDHDPLVDLDYTLQKDWVLRARQSFGGDISDPSDPVPVIAVPNVDPPMKQVRGFGARDLKHDSGEFLLDICAPAVHALDGARGALIDIIRTGIWTSSGTVQPTFRLLSQGRLSDPKTTAISVPRSAISLGDMVTAKQTLCGRSSEEPSNALRVGHKVYIADPRLNMVDFTRLKFADVTIELGCRAAQTLMMKVSSSNENVAKIISPGSGDVTVQKGTDKAVIRVQFLKAGTARLAVVGDHIVAQPASANLAPSELVEIHVFDWIKQQSVEFDLQEYGSGAPQYSGKADSNQITLGPNKWTRVTKLQNTSTGYCGYKLVDAFGPTGNPCIGAKLLDNVVTEIANGYIASYQNGVLPESTSFADMTSVAESKRKVDQTWKVCTWDDSCAGQTVRMKLYYETFSDVPQQ